MGWGVHSMAPIVTLTFRSDDPEPVAPVVEQVTATEARIGLRYLDGPDAALRARSASERASNPRPMSPASRERAGRRDPSNDAVAMATD